MKGGRKEYPILRIMSYSEKERCQNISSELVQVLTPDTKYFLDNIQIANKYRTGLFCFIPQTLFSVTFCKCMSFAVQDYLGPMPHFFVFTLYQHSFNVKELAPDLQQRKTRLSDLELESKIKNTSSNLFSLLKSSSIKVPNQNHSKNASVHSKNCLTLVQTVLITLIQVICWTV